MWRAVLTLGLLGCGAAAPSSGAPITITPAGYDATAMALTDLTPGGPIDLVFPPQGGFVLFVGGRVHDLSDGNVEMRARMIDPGSGALVAENKRVVTLQRDPADANSWIPDLRSFQNVPNVTMCPSSSTTDLFDVPLTLELTVTELTSGRVGNGDAAERAVVPPDRREAARALPVRMRRQLDADQMHRTVASRQAAPAGRCAGGLASSHDSRGSRT